MITKELYDTLVCKADLHSLPKLFDNTLIWYLYKNAYMRAYRNSGDTVIEIFGGDGFSGSLIHWRPDEDEMVSELYTLCRKGNMLVLKRSLLGTCIFYSGPSENYPLPDRRELYFGKKNGMEVNSSILTRNNLTAECNPLRSDCQKSIFRVEVYQNALHQSLPLHRGALGAVSAGAFFDTLSAIRF